MSFNTASAPRLEIQSSTTHLCARALPWLLSEMSFPCTALRMPARSLRELGTLAAPGHHALPQLRAASRPTRALAVSRATQRVS